MLDDDDDELDELPLFQPSAATGLTNDIAKGVVRYLDGETNNDMRKNLVERPFENARGVVIGHKGVDARKSRNFALRLAGIYPSSTELPRRAGRFH